MQLRYECYYANSQANEAGSKFFNLYHETIYQITSLNPCTVNFIRIYSHKRLFLNSFKFPLASCKDIETVVNFDTVLVLLLAFIIVA